MASKQARPPQPQKRISSFGNALDSRRASGMAALHDRTKMVKSPALAAKKITKPALGKAQQRPQTHASSKPTAAGTKNFTYSKEAELKFDDVLSGYFHDLPPVPRSTVRIFLSSTFSDMRAERNTLARTAYPKLRDFCTQLGLSFQVVDLRWGVTAEATNNHLTTKICLLELENCQKVSLGPSCIAIIGNRYGFCPLPYEISVEEYEILKTEATELHLNGLATLETWYKKDENSIPAAYYLQPITSKLTHFLDNAPGHEKQKQEDNASWARIEEEMLSVIHKAAVSACTKGKLSAQRKHFYLMSVTEHEARNGIIDAEDPDKHGLVFVRELKGLGPDTYADTNAARHKDLVKVDGKLEADKPVEVLINSFKNDLNTCLKPENVKRYSVHWQDGGIQPKNNKEHNEYITNFCEDFVEKVKELINADKLAKQSLIRQREYYSYYSEILHHAHFCQMKCKSFCGQHETLSKIKAYILDTSNRKPFVIHGRSGAGKTSIMAMAMNSLQSWIKEEHVGIIRFLGTSPLSTDIYNVLFSVCGQLADNAELIMEPQSYRTMNGLAMYLSRFFRTAATALKQPVVIFLDSLDQLENYYDAYSAWWMPTNLPLNFKIIMSTLPKHGDILKNLHKVLAQPKNFVEVPILPDITSREIINKYLSSKLRKVSDEQMNFILQMFKKSPNPLYLKLLMDQAIQWNSYTAVSELSLPDSVKVAISNLFEKLEVKFGKRFVEGALGLITAGLNGLSEIEIEDALSCMDSVMIEIYKYHDPPVPGIVRVPPVLWARLRFDLQEYLVERQSHGMTTLYWYHRQFVETAMERYAYGQKGQHLHKTLFELYAAEDGVKRDITLTERKNLHVPNADRNTTPQPMTADNLRKLACLTYHMKNSTDVHDSEFVKKATYCNLLFLRAKVASVGVETLIKEIEEYLHVIKDSEVDAVLKFVMTCKTSLKDPVSCAFNVLAHVTASSMQPNLGFLKTMAKEYLLQLPKSMLIPTHACLAPRTGEPEKVYDGLAHVFGYRKEWVLMASKWDNSVMDTNSDAGIDAAVTLAWLNMSNTDLIKHSFEQINSEPFMTVDASHLLYLTAIDNALMRVGIEDGQIDKVPLSDLFKTCDGKLQTSKLEMFDCMISGSADSKHLVVSLGDNIALLEYPGLKPIGEFKEPSAASVTNLHCCRGPPVTVIVTGRMTSDDPSVRGLIAFWDSSKKEMINLVKSKFEIVSKASRVTVGDEYHVCYGMVDEQYVIEVRRVRLAEAFKPVTVKGEIRIMKVSHVAQEVFFCIDESTIKIFNVETQTFDQSFEHPARVVSFDVAWDENRVLVADTNNRLTLYSRDFVRLMSRSGAFGSIDYVSIFQNRMMLLCSGDKVKLWNMRDFFSAGSARRRTGTGDVGRTLDRQEDITCFVHSENGEELITLGQNKICHVWSAEDDSFIREFKVDIAPTSMKMAIEGKIVAFDQIGKRLLVFKADDGGIYCNSLPANVLCYTLTKDNAKIVLATMESKPTIYVYDIKSNSSSKKFTVNVSFKCLSARICLSSSERYAVFMFEITSADFKAIAAMRTKGASFPEQKHPYRFTAVDLSQGNGAPLHVYFRLSKVPQLGVTMEPYKGNTMMISSRRWIQFWDIPTGTCDQTMCKSTRKTKMYRPDWLGQSCVGTNDVITFADNKEFIAVGSQDGYVFIYGGETGMPMGMKAPSTKHPSPVNHVCFNKTCSLLASACTGGYLKLWEPATGNCLFSISVGSEIRQMAFHPSGAKFVAITKAEKSHVLVFDVKEFVG